MSYYLLRDGFSTLDAKRVAKLRDDQEYSLLRHFLNDNMRVKVEWVGGPFADKTPMCYAAPFRFAAWVIVRANAEGDAYDPPKEVMEKSLTAWFRHEREAIAHYEDFLIKEGTGSEWMIDQNGDPRFVERGNKLAPPSKDVPQAPPENEATPETLAAIGSW